MALPSVITEDTISPVDTASSLDRKRILNHENLLWVRTTAPCGTESDWQYHEEVNAYTYVLSGEASILSGGRNSVSVQTGDFVHIPAGTIHRIVVPEDDEFDYLTLLLGSGSTFIALDDSEADIPAGDVTVVHSDDASQTDSTPGVDRQALLENDEVIVIKGDVEGGNVSSWHRHPNREVCSYNIEGTALIEFESDDIESLSLPDGGYINIPPGLVHRASADEAGQKAIAFFVGDGPLVENME